MPSDSDTPLQIHERLLSSVSPTLRTVYQGRWEESTSRVYKFLKGNDGFYENVTEELLTCFIRWAYLGDYSTETVGISSYVEERVAKLEPEPGFENEGWEHSFEVRGKGKKGKKSKGWDEEISTDSKARLEPEPPSIGGPCEETIQNADKVNEVQADGSGTETTKRTHPLFLHIQLYVFANIYLIGSLKAISKQKIVDYLKKVENSHSKDTYTNAIFDLLDCAFLYLPDSDPLLNWLAGYASWNLIGLRKESGRLENLLRKADGKFAVLLVRHVVPSQRNPFMCLS
jgi:hypothetical protein